MDGRCEICDAKAAAHQCIECKKKVCAGCFWTQLGICKSCGDSGTGKIV